MSQDPPHAASPRFQTTRWSQVLAAGRDDSRARAALEELCRAYWYPLYCFARRWGCGTDQAQDAVQGLLLDLLEREALGRADPQRGRFRSFLLAALQHHLANVRRAEGRQKRGGDRARRSLDPGPDLSGGERRYLAEPAHGLTPERLYERQWALTVLDGALARLREEHTERGEQELFARLSPFLGGATAPPSYEDLAARTGLSEGALRVRVHRLRRRCGELVREAVADTVEEQADLEDEVGYLLGLFAG